MTEVLLTLVSVLNVAVGALAWQLRRNGKNSHKDNEALHDTVRLLYSIDGRLNTLLENQKREGEDESKWRVEVRENYRHLTEALGKISKRGEA